LRTSETLAQATAKHCVDVGLDVDESGTSAALSAYKKAAVLAAFEAVLCAKYAGDCSLLDFMLKPSPATRLLRRLSAASPTVQLQFASGHPIAPSLAAIVQNATELNALLAAYIANSTDTVYDGLVVALLPAATAFTLQINVTLLRFVQADGEGDALTNAVVASANSSLLSALASALHLPASGISLAPTAILSTTFTPSPSPPDGPSGGGGGGGGGESRSWVVPLVGFFSVVGVILAVFGTEFALKECARRRAEAALLEQEYTGKPTTADKYTGAEGRGKTHAVPWDPGGPS